MHRKYTRFIRPVRSEGGFTLLEMLVSLAVFSVGMLGLTGLFAMQINANASSIRMNVANNIALAAIEEAKSVPYYLMTSWDPTSNVATIPCQGDGAANLADRVDCLLPDTGDPTVPPAPYNRLVSDAAFVAIGDVMGQNADASTRSFTTGMEVRRTFNIVADNPALNMKTITAQVDWRLAGSNNIHTVSYTTVRDMGVR